MISYDYRCTVCEQPYEFPTNNVDFLCCNKPVRRVYSLGGTIFKGSGFYVNESRSK